MVTKGQLRLPTLDIQALPGPETIHHQVLPNGMTLLTRENFASPSVVISGYIPVGSLLDGDEQAGCAYVTAQGLMEGTKQRPAQVIFESIESIGARLSFSASVHSTVFHAKCLVDDLDALLALLVEVLETPTFPKVEIERLKARILTALAIRAQDTSAQAHLAFDDLVYRDHPYRIPSDGYMETVQSITPTDVRRFHRKYYRPHGLVLSVVGGVSAEVAYEIVERRLGTWSSTKPTHVPDLPTLKRLRKERRKVVRLPGKEQSDLVVGAAGPSRYSPDYLIAAVGNHILGRFGLMGRIGDSVREKAGLAYYAYSAVSGGPGPGPWQVIAGVNPMNEERALEIILKELKRFVGEKVTNEELQESQANLIGRLPLQLESNEGVAGALINIERYQLGLDYYQQYPSLIAGITPEQIMETARMYLDPERMAIGIAGPDRM